MGTFGQDLSYSLRSLRKAPGVTAVAILTLALGVGANSAIFSVVNAMLLRPLPFADAERVVHLAWDDLQSLSERPMAAPRDRGRPGPGSIRYR